MSGNGFGVNIPGRGLRPPNGWKQLRAECIKHRNAAEEDIDNWYDENENERNINDLHDFQDKQKIAEYAIRLCTIHLQLDTQPKMSEKEKKPLEAEVEEIHKSLEKLGINAGESDEKLSENKAPKKV